MRVTRSVGKSSLASALISSSSVGFREGLTFGNGSSSRSEEGSGGHEFTKGEKRFVLSRDMSVGASREFSDYLSAPAGVCREVLVKTTSSD